METIRLKTGENVLIASNRDIVDTVAECCGYDFANILESKIVDVDRERLYAEERAMTDCDFYEADLKSKTFVMQDILDAISELRKYMEEAKRIDKGKIYDRLSSMESTLASEL